MSAGQSVLIIDDQRDLLNVTRIFLERHGGMHVQTAGSAEEGLELLGGAQFDAVVVDYDLPSINGVEFLKILRNRGDMTPIILFTGVGRENAAIEALNSGADFFIKKGEDPHTQFRTLIDVINRASDRRTSGRPMGSAQKILEDTINFFAEPAYAFDHEGKLVAWNGAMENFTGSAGCVVRRRTSKEIAPLILGPKGALLSDLIQEDDAAISRQGYTAIVRGEDGSLSAEGTFTAQDGTLRHLRMKTASLRDARGAFVGTLGSVQVLEKTTDSTATENDPGKTDESPAAEPERSIQSGVKQFLRWRPAREYREGVRLFYREGKYREAIPLLKKSVEDDPRFAAGWHDLGVCYREIHEDNEAVRCFARAADLEPADEEFLFSLGEMLAKVAVQQDNREYLGAAVQIFSKVVEINPNQADAWNNLGLCMKEQGMGELSRQYFDRSRDIILWNKATKKTRNLDRII